MPTNKDFKRLVRGRMHKTGESYTTARTHLLRAHSSRPTVSPEKTVLPVTGVAAPPVPEVSPADYAKVAGTSDATLKAKTGCNWALWVKALDYHKANTWAHRDIAEYVAEKYKVSGWWAQMVTVGYERIRGLRDKGQRRGGSYEASKSKTFAVPAAKLFGAFANARTRKRWLAGVKLTVRKATAPKSLRMTWEDGTSVQVWLTAKGPGKCSAAVQHTGLKDRDAVTRTKQYWAERLDALGEVLTV